MRLLLWAAAALALAPYQIYTVHPDGTHLVHVKNAAEPYQSEPVWSRSGKRIAFVAYDGGDEPLSVYSMDADGRHVQRHSEGDLAGLTAASPTWSPSGGLAAILAPYGAAAPAAPPALTILPDTTVASPAVAAAWSPDGRSFAYADGRRLVVAARDGSRARVVAGGAAPFDEVTSPAWSPDGRRLAFVGVAAGGDSRIFLVGAGGGATVDLTHGAGADTGPAWSPDGRRIAVVRSTRGGRARIVVLAVPGGTARTVLPLPPGARDGELSWSRQNVLAFSFARP